MAWGMVPAMKAAALSLCLVACLGCHRGGVTSPADTIRSFAAAVRAGRYRDAYNRLSVQYRSRTSFESFKTRLSEHPEEAKEIAALLSRTEGEEEIEAMIPLSNGENIKMVFEDGAWRFSGNVAQLYDQSTPRAALRSFVRAMSRRRYDVVMRLVPSEDLPGMTVEQMKAAWDGEGREEIDRLIAQLTEGLSNPIEEVGQRATMSYGDNLIARLIRENGVWKVEDPD